MTEARRPGFLRSPLIRVALAGIVLLILVFIFINVAISLMKSSRNQPINFEIYPGAQLVDQIKKTGGDTQTYETRDSIRQVFEFYAKRHGLAKANTLETDGCKVIFRNMTPIPTIVQGTAEPYVEKQGDWWGVCVVSDSILDVSQELSIKMTYVPTSADGLTGKTVLVVQRNWGN